MSEIIDFHLNGGTNHSGKTFEDIMKQGYQEFENSHDQIQWLFPLPEKSECQPDEPVLSYDDINELTRKGFADNNLILAKRYMLNFYMNEWNGWNLEFDHNHLRITRIIKCISLFKGYHNSSTFFTIMSELDSLNGSKVNTKSFYFWSNARYYDEEYFSVKEK